MKDKDYYKKVVDLDQREIHTRDEKELLQIDKERHMLPDHHGWIEEAWEDYTGQTWSPVLEKSYD